MVQSIPPPPLPLLLSSRWSNSGTNAFFCPFCSSHLGVSLSGTFVLYSYMPRTLSSLTSSVDGSWVPKLGQRNAGELTE